MRKIGVILSLGIISISCSVTRNSGSKAYQISNNSLSSNKLEGVKNQNITNFSFLISRADIEVINTNGKEKFMAIIKFEYPDKYIVSLKSRSGIEGIRAYVTGDSILINDRINKKLLTGTSQYLRKKFGLTQDLLPIILGDIVTSKESRQTEEQCMDNKIITEQDVGGTLLKYEIDCIKMKSVLVSRVNNLETKDLKIVYRSFFNANGVLTPRIIELKDSQLNTEIKIKIIKLERPWKGKVEFIPGRGYEIIKLL